MYPIGPMFLASGFLKHTNFIEFMDQRLPQKEKNYTVSHGEVLAVLLLTLVSGLYSGISTVHLVLKRFPIKQIPSIESPYRTIRAADFSGDVLNAALDAMVSVSSSNLFLNFVNYAYSKFQDTSDEVSVHMDTTSIILYHKFNDKDRKVLELNLDKTKKVRSTKHQYSKFFKVSQRNTVLILVKLSFLVSLMIPEFLYILMFTVETPTISFPLPVWITMFFLKPKSYVLVYSILSVILPVQQKSVLRTPCLFKVFTF